MIYANKFNIKYIMLSIDNGQWGQAKDLIQYKCKTKPEKQAYRLAQVVGALIERGSNDQAARLINRFDK